MGVPLSLSFVFLPIGGLADFQPRYPCSLTGSKALEDGEISKAMILALALNDYALLRKVYEQAYWVLPD